MEGAGISTARHAHLPKCDHKWRKLLAFVKQMSERQFAFEHAIVLGTLIPPNTEKLWPKRCQETFLFLHEAVALEVTRAVFGGLATSRGRPSYPTWTDDHDLNNRHHLSTQCSAALFQCSYDSLLLRAIRKTEE
jgi:hypothetical protein